MELAVDVAADGHRGVDELHVGFFDEQLAGFVAELADGGFGDGFAGAEGFDGTGGVSGVFGVEGGGVGYRSSSLMVEVWGKEGGR